MSSMQSVASPRFGDVTTAALSLVSFVLPICMLFEQRHLIDI